MSNFTISGYVYFILLDDLFFSYECETLCMWYSLDLWMADPGVPKAADIK